MNRHYSSPATAISSCNILVELRVKEGNVVNHTIKRQVFSSATWSTVGGLSAGDGKEKALKITVKK